MTDCIQETFAFPGCKGRQGEVCELSTDPPAGGIEGFYTPVQILGQLHTLTWPNGADLAPEYPYQSVSV